MDKTNFNIPTETVNTSVNTDVTSTQVTETTANESTSVSKSTRGRPRLNVAWPEGEFTFLNLEDKNVLSSSSLRKKIRAELKAGGILKVGTLKTAFGRPLNLYKRSN